jgi:hypothetical protein
MVGAVYQLVHVTLPDEVTYFRGHNNPDLEVGVKVVAALLATNSIVCLLVSAFAIYRLLVHYTASTSLVAQEGESLLIRMCRRHIARMSSDALPSDPEINRDVCILCFCFLKVFTMMISIVAYYYWPSRGGALVGWALVLTFNFGMGCCLYGLQHSHMLLLWFVTCGGCFLFVAALWASGDYIIQDTVTTIIVGGMGLTSLILSRRICETKRRSWQRLAGDKVE